MEVHVMRHEEIDIPVLVIVTKRRARSPTRVAVQTAALRHVRESSVPLISIKNDSMQAAHDKVGPSIIVVVSHGHTKRPTGITHSRFFCHISEGAVVVVVI